MYPLGNSNMQKYELKGRKIYRKCKTKKKDTTTKKREKRKQKIKHGKEENVKKAKKI